MSRKYCPTHRRRRAASRRLFLETLESRRVFNASSIMNPESPPDLNGDLILPRDESPSSVWHNANLPADANNSGHVEHWDLIMLKDQWAASGEMDLPPGAPPGFNQFIDTDNDGWFRQADIDLVQRALEEPGVAIWQNPSNPLDVNNDGMYSPLDYLLMVNEFNKSGEHELSTELPAEGVAYFVDVDGDGWLRPRDVGMTYYWDQSPLASLDLRITDAAGNELTHPHVGETIYLYIDAVDLRTDGTGVFSAYADLLFEPAQVELVDAFISFHFPNGTSGSTEIPGQLNELGGFGDFSSSSSSRRELARVAFRILAPGPLSFQLDPADQANIHEVLLNGSDDPVPSSRVQYGSISVEAMRNWQNPALRYDVNKDGVVAPIDALLLINLLNSSGAQQLTANMVLPEGTSNYFWDVNGDNYVAPLDVLQIINFLNRQPIVSEAHRPDDPITDEFVGDDLVDNEYTVASDQSTELNVLANDHLLQTFAPRPGGPFVFISTPLNGGTVTILDSGLLSYTPKPGFVGDDSFSYGFAEDGEKATVHLHVVRTKKNSGGAEGKDSLAAVAGLHDTALLSFMRDDAF